MTLSIAVDFEKVGLRCAPDGPPDGCCALLSLVILLPAVGGQAAGDTPLVAAAKDDDLQAVRALIAKRANVNEPARDGSTALLWATYNSNLEMARALIAAGAQSTRRIITASRRCFRPAARAMRRSSRRC